FLHLLWRLYLLDRDVDDARSEAVAIEDRLGQRKGVARDEVLLFIEDAVDAGAANHLAHGGLARLPDDLLGLRPEVVVEEVVARRTDPELHRELHVDDALVAG